MTVIDKCNVKQSVNIITSVFGCMFNCGANKSLIFERKKTTFD